MEDYPHSRTKVCKAVDNERNNFEDIKRVVEDLKDPERTLKADGEKLYFNHHDISQQAMEMTKDYLEGSWEHLGWHFGSTLKTESEHHGPGIHHGFTEPSVGEDPRKEYYDKIGAEFSRGFLAGTHVGDFDEIDLFECVEKEPKAFVEFVKADEKLKEALYTKDSRVAVEGLDELVGFVIELVLEDYPHTHVQVCKDFDKTKKSDWSDLHTIIELLKNHETSLQAFDNKLYFNKKDISTAAGNMVEDYLKGEFGHLGWNLGKALDEASKDDLFLY